MKRIISHALFARMIVTRRLIAVGEDTRTTVSHTIALIRHPDLIEPIQNEIMFVRSVRKPLFGQVVFHGI